MAVGQRCLLKQLTDGSPCCVPLCALDISTQVAEEDGELVVQLLGTDVEALHIVARLSLAVVEVEIDANSQLHPHVANSLMPQRLQIDFHLLVQSIHLAAHRARSRPQRHAIISCTH